MATPKTRRQLQRFIGLVNFYRDITLRRSEILAPLTALTSSKVPFKWQPVHQKAFDKMKMAISQYTTLQYPDFSKPFHIHTDASDTQLGSVISQNDQPIAFYSRKLTSPQQKYTTGEKELLSIVETLKEFRNILLGQELIVHTDHKNLTYKNYNSDRVMRWRLLLEEYGPTFQYIPGEKNIVADALSRLEIDEPPPFKHIKQESLFYQDQMSNLEQEIEHEDIMPVDYNLIYNYQSKDKHLHNLLHSKKSYHEKTFHGGGKSVTLICHKDKIVIPTKLQKKVISWYHKILVHPGVD